MGAYGANYGTNFTSALLEGTITVISPTKTVTADLCVNQSVNNDLCVNESVKKGLCVTQSVKKKDLCV